MSRETWNDVDHHFEKHLHGDDDVLRAALKASDEAGLPHIAVSSMQGKLLHLMVKMQGAKRVLEVGTLGGYSTIWLARALPADGALTTLELDAKHAGVARGNLERAGFAKLATVVEGPAMGSLDKLVADQVAPFDFVFIDADKPNNPGYFTRALALTKPGSVIVVDNVVRGGEIVDPRADANRVKGVNDLLAMLQKEPRVEATAIQTVGTKGYDGFLLARVK